jgi:hypothetical protein
MRALKRPSLGLIIAGLVILGGCLLLPCVEKVRDGEGWALSAVSLKQIALAMHNYQSDHGTLPPAVVRGKDGQPLYSWRVLLLPYLEQDALYRNLKLDEPWDSPHNEPLLRDTPKCFRPRLGGGNEPPGHTHYQVLVGPGTPFERDGLTFDDLPYLADTILVVEARDTVPWASPADLTYAPGQPIPPLGAGFTKPVEFFCYTVKRKPGFVAAFADGSTRFIDADIDEKTLRNLISHERSK